jgi:hypothetical protein
LDVKEVSEFLVKKIQKKLKYWSSLHLHLDRRVLIVNAILVLHFGFLLLFGGLKKRQLKGACQCCTTSNALEVNTILGQESINMIVVLKKVLED